MSLRSKAVVALIVTSLPAGCAARTTRDSATTAPPGASVRGIVVASELARVGRGQSMMSALAIARPFFLTGRGTPPMVSIDGSPAVELSVLRAIPVQDVFEVRLLRGAAGMGRSAVLPNGDVVVGDVILVLTRIR